MQDGLQLLHEEHELQADVVMKIDNQLFCTRGKREQETREYEMRKRGERRLGTSGNSTSPVKSSTCRSW